jgi:hypothetical protein
VKGVKKNQNYYMFQNICCYNWLTNTAKLHLRENFALPGQFVLLNMALTSQKLSKNCQRFAKSFKIGQKIVKNCRSFVKHLSKFCDMGKGCGEEEKSEESEEDWWLRDH